MVGPFHTLQTKYLLVQTGTTPRLSKEAILGPFEAPPFHPWTQCSPLMTRDKPDGSGKRVIIDLSFPEGASVNDGIQRHDHLGNDAKYTLPTATDLSDLMLERGQGSFMWKSDLSRAYRQLRIDPLDYSLLAIKHRNQVFVDICPSFGCRASGSAQQRLSEAVVHLMAQEGHTILAYVDDFCGIAETYQEAEKSFKTFKTLTSDLGLQLAEDKTFPPDQAIQWLGFEFDSNAMTVVIPQEKMEDIISEAETWMTRDWATKQQIQSLAGKLNFISHCVRPARKFMSRILHALREAKEATRIRVTHEFRQDVAWFLHYSRQANGRILLQPKLPMFTLECDACPSGAGGFSQTNFYHFPFPDHYRDSWQIHQL